MPHSFAFFVCLALSLLLPSAALAQDVLLDTFDDEEVGSPPVAPDVGSYSGTPLGDHTVVDPGTGDLRLRCNDDSTSGGCRFTFQPTQSLDRSVTEYLYRVESGVTPSGGANDFDQQLILSPPGTNLTIEWSAFIGQLGVRIFADGGETQFFVSNFQWAADTDYFVEIETDAASDAYTLSVNGELLVDEALGADFTAVDRLSFRSGFVTTGATQIDDVRISPLPEPGRAASLAAALLTLVWIRSAPGTRRIVRGRL